MNEWNPELNVGVASIDKQHKIIFDLISDLGKAIEDGKDRRRIEKLLDVVENFVYRHFHAEEELLKQHADRIPHTLEHYNLMREFNIYRFNLRYKKQEKIPLHTFVHDWFVNHIKTQDIPTFQDSAKKQSPHTSPPPEEKQDRRRNKRIPQGRITDDDIRAQCYNFFNLKKSTATVVDIACSGLRISSIAQHNLGDLVNIKCRIGTNFKLDEKLRVVDVSATEYGLEFIDISEEARSFLTNLYGAIGRYSRS